MSWSRPEAPTARLATTRPSLRTLVDLCPVAVASTSALLWRRVAAHRGSHLCVIRPRKGGQLEATFYAPGPVAAIVETLAAFEETIVAVDAPQAPRKDLLRPGAQLRKQLGLSQGKHERSRVCDAMLVTRGISLYQVPRTRENAPTWMDRGFELYGELERKGLRRFRPPDSPTHSGGTRGAWREGTPHRDVSVRCVLLRLRLPPASQDQPAGLRCATPRPRPGRRCRPGQGFQAAHAGRTRRVRRSAYFVHIPARRRDLGRCPNRGCDGPPIPGAEGQLPGGPARHTPARAVTSYSPIRPPASHPSLDEGRRACVTD